MIGLTLIVGLIFGALSASAAERQEEWKAEWEKLVQSAEREGKLTVYAGSYEELVWEFQKVFSKIKVSSVVDPGRLAIRIMGERRAGKYLTDVLISGVSDPTSILSKVLDPLKPMLIHPEILDESKWHQGKHWWGDLKAEHVFIFLGNPVDPIAISTRLVKPGDIQSYWDLLHPKWKGKIMARDIRRPGPALGNARLLYYHPEIGPKFVYRLYSEMDPFLAADDRILGDYLATGRYSFLLYPATASRSAKDAGLPVDNLRGLKEGGMITSAFGTLSVLNQAPHPNAAKVFVNWVLSREGQLAFQRRTKNNSLRIDISKADVEPDRIRDESKLYFSGDRPCCIDSRPVLKVIEDGLRAGGRY